MLSVEKLSVFAFDLTLFRKIEDRDVADQHRIRILAHIFGIDKAMPCIFLAAINCKKDDRYA